MGQQNNNNNKVRISTQSTKMEPQPNPNPDRHQIKERYLQAAMLEKRERVAVDAPREISKKSYSLAPDMATGWKPRRAQRINFQNVFPINFSNLISDEVIKHCTKKNSKYEIAYLGPRKQNSYKLHEDRSYENPYPLDKKVDTFMSERPGISKQYKVAPTNLQFNSDFESGNIDAAIRISEAEYDLFMRVDSNTKGHTNWYYFEVKNEQWVGEVQFNFLNFRRERSLYQRGMKPYVQSAKGGQVWVQGGRKVAYEKKPMRYKFLYDEDEDYIDLLYTYFTMSFTYDFDTPHDTVRFAYCIPYTYSQMLSMVREISANVTPQEFKFETGWRTLSGLPVPILQLTDFSEPVHNKKVVLVTARIHPGESNSSYVCEGLVRAISSDQPRYKQLRKKYHFYIIPMLNPDGVIAGNYRTSLFGKDLNRTFNQSRKYAFPEIFHLIEHTKKLKKEHKQRLSIYLDLHGHSVKKNVFFYGPDYNMAHNYYNESRDFAKILGNLTPMFRYYSCIFKISTEKATTARATFNRVVNIPFTYTMESSNGGYYDSEDHQEKTFTAGRLLDMGATVAKGLGIWFDNQKKPAISRSRHKKYAVDSDDSEECEQGGSANEKTQKQLLLERQPPGKQKVSDDDISEGKSDSEPEDQDLGDEQLRQLEEEIQGPLGKTESPLAKTKKDDLLSRLYPVSPQKSDRGPRPIDWSQNLRSCRNDNARKSVASQAKRQKLPPINLQSSNPAKFLNKNHSNKRRLVISEALSNLTQAQIRPAPESERKQPQSNRISLSQMMVQAKQGFGVLVQQQKNKMYKKLSKQDLSLNRSLK